MNKTRKIMLTVLAASIVIGGCSNNANDSAPSESEATGQAGTPAAAEKNMYGWVKPEKTTVFDYYVTDQGDNESEMKNRTMLQQYLLDEFNVDIRKDKSDVNPKERLNLMLVSGDYKPVIVGMDDEDKAKWAAQNKIIDLAPLIEEHAPGIKEALGDNYNSYLDEDGRLWGLPRGWGPLPIPDVSAHIRWDWYQEMGAPAIETPEDYYNVLKQMVAAHPTDANGNKTYAISWNDGVNIDQILGFWGLKQGYKEGAEHNLTHWVNTAEGLEAIQYYNRFYREGLMDPEAFVNKFEDWRTKFSNEQIIGHIGPWWQSWNAGHEVWSQEPNYSEDKRYVQISFKDPEAEKAYANPKDGTGWNYVVITDKEKDPVAALKLLEFSMSPMGTRLFGWGVPNQPDSLWNFDGTKWEFNEKQKQLMVDNKPDYPLFDTFGGTVYWLASPQTIQDDPTTSAYFNQSFNQFNKWTKLRDDNMRDTIYDSTARRITFAPDNPLTIVNQQIEDAIKSGIVKAIMSKTEEEAVQNFNQLKENLNKIGLAKIEQFRTEEYKKNVEKMQ